MRSVILALGIVAIFALTTTQAQFVPWTQKFLESQANSTSTSKPVSKCQPGKKKNCWEQIGKADNVVMQSQTVSSSVFPCTSGQSATTFVFDTKVTLNDGDCLAECSGVGCDSTTFSMCKQFGLNCPVAPTTGLVAVGPTKECQSGLGSYVITITCEDFAFKTYFTY